MPSKIRVLSDLTINQIAAGEVIENPSSVVKELVENSIDAGAKTIKVEIKAGGLQSIKIIDDGCGMSQDDAILSIERHATSKILNVEDLFSISSMGFRGEALASIAAISKFTLITSEGHDTATKIEVEGGKILSVDKAARAQGTTIEVRSLFFNVPARKKFQKSASACSLEIHRILTNLSLAYPHVHFELINQDKRAFSFSAYENSSLIDALSQRIKLSLGNEFLNCCYKVEMQEGPYIIHGFVGAPLYTRHNRSGQYLFINKRHVISPAISFAVQDGYATRLATGRHPVYVLHVQMDPQQIDVNVHPQKREVRFKEESLIKETIKSCISEALQKAEGFSSSLTSFSTPFSFEKDSFTSEKAEEFSFSHTPSFEFKSAYPSYTTSYNQLSSATSEEYCAPSAFEVPELALEQPPKIIGLFQDFLFVEAWSVPMLSKKLKDLSQNGIVLVDLSAARARIAYDDIMNTAQIPILKQSLLFPLTLALSIPEMETIQHAMPLLNEMGFEVNVISKDAISIETIPPFISENDSLALLKEFLGSESISSVDHYRKRVALLAAKFARSQKNFIAIDEALLVLKKLLKTVSPFHCPLGKNTLQVLGTHELREFINKQ